MNQVTPNDRERSATTTHIWDFERALQPLHERGIRSMLDIGCGFGGLSRFAADYLAVSEVHGLDVDPTVIDEARTKGVDARLCDVSKDPLPFDDESLDVVISLGMMDYLPTFDAMMLEMHRVLTPGGYVLVALPNLGSRHNRLALLMGYQPRDVELSTKWNTGMLPRYGHEPIGHIHAPTVRAFRELMEYHG